jgi:hypothetical protein
MDGMNGRRHHVPFFYMFQKWSGSQQVDVFCGTECRDICSKITVLIGPLEGGVTSLTLRALECRGEGGTDGYRSFTQVYH